MGNDPKFSAVSKEWTFPLGIKAFKPGFEEHHPTENKNSALGITFDLRQGLSSKAPSKHIMSDIGGHKPA